MLTDLQAALTAIQQRHEIDADELSNHIRDNFSGTLMSLKQLEPLVTEILRRFKALPHTLRVDGTHHTIGGYRTFKTWCIEVLHRNDRTVRYMLAGGNMNRKKETVSAVPAERYAHEFYVIRHKATGFFVQGEEGFHVRTIKNAGEFEWTPTHSLSYAMQLRDGEEYPLQQHLADIVKRIARQSQNRKAHLKPKDFEVVAVRATYAVSPVVPAPAPPTSPEETVSVEPAEVETVAAPAKAPSVAVIHRQRTAWFNKKTTWCGLQEGLVKKHPKYICGPKSQVTCAACLTAINDYNNPPEAPQPTPSVTESTPTDYARTHTCTATTKKGTPCRVMDGIRDGLCGIHHPEMILRREVTAAFNESIASIDYPEADDAEYRDSTDDEKRSAIQQACLKFNITYAKGLQVLADSYAINRDAAAILQEPPVTEPAAPEEQKCVA